LTVPPLFGWEHILTGLTVLVVVAVVFLLVAASGMAENERSDWRAGLDARSRARRDPEFDPEDEDVALRP
jgi:hypothetical protein